MKNYFLPFVSTLLVLPLLLHGAELRAEGMPSPQVEMTTTLDSIIAIVESNPADSQKEIRRQKLRELINPRFNFAEMSRRALGTSWNDITEAEQQDFVTVFSTLLARTYLSKIETVKKGMVEVVSESVEGSKAIVKTKVESKGDTFPIDYKLLLEEGHWKVYDVIVENIGLVANYRNEFSGIIRKDGFAGLMTKLREKNAAA